jgi:predicted nucleic-acid-binding protein
MIAIDTNVLVRLLVRDDVPQAAAADALVQQAHDRDEQVLVTTPVLCELAWVLQAAYDASRADITAAVRALLDDGLFEVADREAASQALVDFGTTRADFPDCLIAALARRAGARQTMTFDRQMFRVPGCTRVRVRPGRRVP